jgi:hypothetical protein
MALENVNGRQTFFGPLPTKNKFGGKVQASGVEKEIKYTFSYDDLPDADSLNEMVAAIPANAKLVGADLFVGTAWVGGTNLSVGLEQKDGTVIDADGVHAAILTAALTANSFHAGGGALVGDSIGANEAIVAVTTTGTFTAGDATLVVKYVPAGADAA